IEASKVVEISPAQDVERAAHHDLPVLLNRERKNLTVASRVKSSVQAPIGIEPADLVARQSAQGAEIPPDQDLPVRLHDHAIDDRIGSRVEGGINLYDINRERGRGTG